MGLQIGPTEVSDMQTNVPIQQVQVGSTVVWQNKKSHADWLAHAAAIAPAAVGGAANTIGNPVTRFRVTGMSEVGTMYGTSYSDWPTQDSVNNRCIQHMLPAYSDFQWIAANASVVVATCPNRQAFSSFPGLLRNNYQSFTWAELYTGVNFGECIFYRGTEQQAYRAVYPFTAWAPYDW
jgi:hypothetical protein